MQESEILNKIIPEFGNTLEGINKKEYDIIDTHIHGRSLFNLFGFRIPESDNSPEAIVSKLSKLKINGVVLEHYFKNITRKGYNPSVVPLKAEKEAKRKGIKVYPGLEIEFRENQLEDEFWEDVKRLELIVFPWREKIDIQKKSELEIIDYCKDNNILITEPHPDRFVLGDYKPVSHVKKLMEKVNGIEVINGGHPTVSIKSSALMYYMNSKQLDNIGSTVGGSDAHVIKNIGSAYTLCPKGEDFLELLRKKSKKLKAGGIGSNNIKEGIDWYRNTKRLVNRAIDVINKKREPSSQFEEISKDNRNLAIVGRFITYGMIKPFVSFGGARFIYNQSLKQANKHYHNILRNLN